MVIAMISEITCRVKFESKSLILSELSTVIYSACITCYCVVVAFLIRPCNGRSMCNRFTGRVERIALHPDFIRSRTTRTVTFLFASINQDGRNKYQYDRSVIAELSNSFHRFIVKMI